MKVITAGPGGEREAVLADQLAEASSKVHDLEKALSDRESEIESAKKRAGTAEALSERTVASREAAEAEVLSVREELSVAKAEMERMTAAMGSLTSIGAREPEPRTAPMATSAVLSASSSTEGWRVDVHNRWPTAF